MNKLFYFFGLLIFLSCSDSGKIASKREVKSLSYSEEKVNGISMVSPKSYLEEEDFAPLVEYNFNWVAVSPFAFVRKNNAQIIYNAPFQWESEKPLGVVKAIQSAQGQGLKVMLKPQLWGHDLFTGHIHFNSDTEWQQFENDYSKYIFQMAHIADSCGIDIFCIGTELANFVAQRPQYWTGIIDSVKAIYSGKLTYAENWDQVEKVHFWQSLDYIGSDAYYPLSSADKPSVDNLNEGWEKWCKSLSELSKRVNKKVLFTEWGYRSIEKNAHEPWKHDHQEKVNLSNQTNAYRSYFQSVYHQDWFAGGFLWKWYPNSHGLPQSKDGYTPQGKPSLEVFKQLQKK